MRYFFVRPHTFSLNVLFDRAHGFEIVSIPSDLDLKKPCVYLNHGTIITVLNVLVICQRISKVGSYLKFEEAGTEF